MCKRAALQFWSSMLIAAKAFALTACATAGPTPPAEQAHKTAEAARVATLAPDLAARGERAERAAEQETTSEGQRDTARRARFLEQAAEAEADRVELEREFARVEQRLAAAVDQRAVAERARLRAEQQRVLMQSAISERAEAAAVFAALAASDRPTRADSERIANFLARRAQARLSAALALGANGPERSEAETRLTAALASGAAERASSSGARVAPAADSGRRVALTRDRVALARAALLAAERALGIARQQTAQASAEQTRDLLARARERGFRAESSASGVSIHLAPPFTAGSAEPRAELRTRLQLLAEILPAFPHGPIRIACQAGSASRADQTLARARGARMLEVFAHTTERTRLVVDAPAGESADLQLNLPAYLEPSSSSGLAH